MSLDRLSWPGGADMPKWGLKGLFGACLSASLLAGLTVLPAPQAAQAQNQQHYLCDFPVSDPLRYQDFRWLPKELPVKVYIPPVPFQTPNPNMYIPLVQQAFNSWTAVAPALRFSFVDDPNQAQIDVVWHEHFPENEGTWGQAYFPLPIYSRNKQRELLGHVSQLHLAIKAQPGSGMGTGAILFSHEELLAVSTHEVGHALGLPHSRNPDDLMSPYIFKFSATSKWGISQRDINTLYALYGLPKKLTKHPCR